MVDVVISGIGGHFPRSKNIQEFGENLLAGECLLEPINRWQPGLLGTPTHVGLTPDADKFDYTFFGMNAFLAATTDPMALIEAEVTYEAIIDAGYNPSEIRGSNTQVYVACQQVETDCSMEAFGLNTSNSGYFLIGKSWSMAANRISYILGINGSSTAYGASSAWLGEGLALAKAAIQSGECDSALVNGSSLLAFTEISKLKQSLGLLSPDSSSRPFDIDVDGVGRAEAQITFFVQRADIARRSYGSLVLVDAAAVRRSPDWFLSLDEDYFRDYVREVYRKNGLDPNKVQILEAYGLCIKNMVEAELNALDDVLNANRPQDSPLYLGSVTTITGDTEAASGFTSLTKLILSMETGIIPPTINCGKLNPNIRGIAQDRFKLITKPTTWEVTPDTHVAVSSLSTNGIVSHVVLKANGKTKNRNIQNTYPLPYLILLSGRNERFVAEALEKVISSPFDPEYIRLIQGVFSPKIDRLEWKGFGFHGQDSSEKIVVQRGNRRPVWFVYSGMGSQWPGMGKDLILFPIVSDTFQRLQLILEPKGIDLLNILTTLNDNIFDNILHSFVGIAAIQIALTNLLRELGMEPDGIIGHSVGEIGCSYADGCLSEEQAILAAYERGKASVTAELIPGLMAAVGLGYDEVKSMLPSDVYVACHNSRHSCTISGPTESVKQVQTSFEDKGIFVRGVNVSNIAYHSPYIKPVAPLLYKSLRKVIPSPRLRSSKWICTSAPKEKWETDEVRYCSADYHTNNLLNPVLFEEGAAYIPENALVIEIAPHGLLQAILRRSLGNDVAYVSLTRRGTSSPAKFLLQAIGKLYLEGLSPKIWLLYPEVQFPVSRGTPSLVPLLRWEHEETFPFQQRVFEECFPFNNEDALRQGLYDFCPKMEIAGIQTILPAYILILVWRKLAEANQTDVMDMKVIFKDVHFYDLIKFEEKETTGISVDLFSASGLFTVTRDEKLLGKGNICELDEETYVPPQVPSVQGKVKIAFDSNDVYSELKSRGLGFPEQLKIIEQLEEYPQDWIATVRFDEDYSILLNSFFALFQLRSGCEEQKPEYLNHIQQLVIDPTKTSRSNYPSTVRLHLSSSTLVHQGISMFGVDFRTIEKPAKKIEPVLYRFIPFGPTGLKEEKEFLSSVVQLSLEKRLTTTTITRIYDVDGAYKSFILKICDVFNAENGTKCEITKEQSEADILVCECASVPNVVSILASSNNILLTRCNQNDKNKFKNNLEKLGLAIIAESYNKNDTTQSLLAITSLLPPIEPVDCHIIKMKPNDLLPSKLNVSGRGLIILVWENGIHQSIEKIVGDVALQRFAKRIRLVILMTPNLPAFSLNDKLYADQIRLNVPVNFYVEGKWGSYRLIGSTMRAVNETRDPTICVDTLLKNFNNQNGVKVDRAGPLSIHRIDILGKNPLNSEEIVGYCWGDSEGPKMIGVASCDEVSDNITPDPHFHWIVSKAWSQDEAATIPQSYAIAYYILSEVIFSESRRKVFITCPLTSVGQAFVRVAESIGSEVIALVESPEEADLLRTIFPKFNLNNIIVSSSDTFTYELKRMVPLGFDAIICHLSGTRMRTLTSCLKYLFGYFVQIGDETMVNGDYLGSAFLLKAAYVCGVTHKSITTASVEVKKKVAELVQKGLDSQVVCPLWTKTKCLSKHMNGSFSPEESSTGRQLIPTKINGHHEEPSDINTKYPRKLDWKRTQTFIIGGSKAQWMKLSHWLARKGTRLITLIQEKPSQSLVARLSEILRSKFGTELKEITSIAPKDILFSESKEPDLKKSFFIFEHDKFSEDVVGSIDETGWKDVQLTFLSQMSTHFSRMCDLWARSGMHVRAALGVEDVPTDAASPLLDWLLSPAAPTVVVLDRSSFLDVKSQIKSLNKMGLLPTSTDELQTLGSSLRNMTSPKFRELATRSASVRMNLEVKPLFFIKGIHGTATTELETLASNLFAPLVEVTLPADCGSLDVTALAVMQGIQRIQNKGPYNLAGDTLRIDVVSKIAQLLEEAGFASVVFYLDDDIDSIGDVLARFQQGDRFGFGEFLLWAIFSENLDALDCQNWDSLTWKEQVQAVVSNMPALNFTEREDIALALNHVYNSLLHLMEREHLKPLDHGLVHFFRRGGEYCGYKMNDVQIIHIIPSSKLKHKDIGEYISPNLATPDLQMNFFKIQSKKLL